MKSLPSSVEVYKNTRIFDENSTPAGLLHHHTTKAGTWGRIVVLEGSLLYRILEPALEEHLLDPDNEGVVEPEVAHELELRGPVRFQVHFLRQD